MGVVVIFWAVFHQNATALTNWAEKYTDREAPEFVEGTLVALSLNQTVTTELQDSIVLTDKHFNPILKLLTTIPYYLNW